MALPDSKHDQQILQAIAAGGRVTQRSLSRDLGVALGLTNLLIRRLVGKGYVKIAGMGTRHVRYLMTPEGWEALARAARYSLENTVHLYTQTREQIRTSLTTLSTQCKVNDRGQKCVVFYGAGDVAEIAYVSLQRTDLTLAGVVDDRRGGRFFDMEILGPEYLSAETLNAIAYSHVIVASIRHSDVIQARISQLGVPRNRVFCL
jgi:DNA-binding MarR family transcriptional regulator